MTTFVRAAGKGRGIEATSLRFAFGIVTILLLWAARVIPIRIVNKPLLCVRGIVGGISALCLFIAIGHVGLGQTSVLYFSYPVFTALFASFFLGERPTLGTWCAIAVALAGEYLIVWPTSWSGVVAYKLLAVLGALLAGIAITSVRRLRSTDSSYTIFLSFCVFGLLIVAWPASRQSFAFGAGAWAALLGVGVMGTLGQLVMTFAYKFVPATEGSVFSFFTPVLNLVLAALIFHEQMPLRGWAGACLVIGACIYVSVLKRGGAPTTPAGGN